MAGTVNLRIPEQVDSRRAMLGRWLWPPRCLLCGARGAVRDLCGACAAALPWLGNACRRCALPLPPGTPAPAPGCPPSLEPLSATMSHPAAAGRDGGPAYPAAGQQGDHDTRAARAADDPLALCGACLGVGAPLAEAHAACLYRSPLDRLLPRFKFHQDLAAGRLLAQLMMDAFAPVARGWAAPATLHPLPLHRLRLRQRGYDQALELARPLSRAFGLPLQCDLLVRTRHTAPQSRLDADRRRHNLRGAFAVRPRVALPAHVVLVDDVMTTGATLHAAATALRRAGVERVDAWVCARVP